jgi:hypothetical protein
MDDKKRNEPILQDLKVINNTHGKISDSNDMILRETRHLKNAIMTLQIAEYNKNLSAIKPITQELIRITTYIKETLQDLVNTDRENLRNSTNNVDNYVRTQIETLKKSEETTDEQTNE